MVGKNWVLFKLHTQNYADHEVMLICMYNFLILKLPILLDTLFARVSLDVDNSLL